MRPARFFLLLALALLPASALHARTLYEKGQFKILLSGYYQGLTSSTEDPFFGEHITDDTTRLRMTFRGLTGTALSTELSLDTTYTFGSILGSPLFQIAKALPPPTYFNWQRAYIDEDARYGALSVYRAMVTIEAKKYRLIIGRQRLAYGTAMFWSPIDIWNPSSPLALEPQEKVGVDGISGIWWISDKMSATALAALADTWDEARVAASYSFSIESYTFDFLAGKRGEDGVYGLDFVGYVGGAGLRGEFTYTVAHERDDYARAVIGMDYAWKSSLYGACEYYYNGGPLKLDPRNLLDNYLNATGVDTFHRNFLGVMLSYDLDPLVKGSLAAILDLDGGSEAIAPSLSWSASGRLTITAGAQFFRGARSGEYGSYSDLGWLKVRWDF